MSRAIATILTLAALPLTVACASIMQGTIQKFMDGYQPNEVTLTKSTSGWVWRNIVFGGIIALAVDTISGGPCRRTPA